MTVTETADFSNATILIHRQEKVLDSLKQGKISDVRVSQSYAADKVVSFGLREGFLQEGLKWILLQKLSTLFDELKRQTTLNATPNRRQRPSRVRHPIAHSCLLIGGLV